MASLNLKKSKKILILAIALLVVISTVICTVAVFTDRVKRTANLQISTFDDEGYAITRTAPNGYFTAGETVEATLSESNKKSENITSQITMTVTWDSPVPNSYPWGNTSAGNAVIEADGTTIPYTVNDNKSITFTLPKKALSAKTSGVESSLHLQIPSDLASTGTLHFNFDTITLGYASWTTQYDNTSLASLDYDIDVVWNISKTQTTSAGNPNLDVIAFLTDSGITGQYGLSTIKNGSDNNTNDGNMMDWTAKDQTPWAPYTITSLSLDEGITTIGDYAFAGETGITALTLPSTTSSIGTSAFDGIGLSGELVVPDTVETIESLAFGNLPNVNEITFEHTSSSTLSLPDNTTAGKETSGAFYVPNYVKTAFDFNDNSTASNYNWIADNRMKVGITELELSYEDVVIGQTVDANLDILPKDHDEYQSIFYEVIEGDEYAKVDSTSGEVTGLAQGIATVKVTIIDANGDEISTTGTVKVLGIGVTSAELKYNDVVVGYTVDPQLTILPTNHGPIQKTVYEVTAGSAYAKVDASSGVVTGLSQGTATIKVTVTDTNGDTVSTTGTVKVLGIGITSAELKYNDVVVGYTVDPQLTILPTNHGPIQKTVYEVTAGSAFAKVDASSGVVTGLAQGTATIKVTVTDTNGETISTTGTVKVLGIGVTSAELKYNDVVVGYTVDPQLTILPTNHGPIQKTVYEVTAGSAYAKVDASSGVVTGLAQGTATIKVTVTDTNGDTVSTTGTVKVLGIGVTSAELKYNDVVVGYTVDPQLTILPTNHGPIQKTVYEVTAGSAYAKVDASSGVVTGLAQGTATIKVTVTDTNGDTISTTGTVKVLGIGVTSATLKYDDVEAGKTVDPQFTILPSNYDDCQSIIFEVISGSSYASVDPDTGVVTGLDKGTATIRVTIVDTNGDTITADGTVNVYLPVPVLAPNCTWFDPATEFTYESNGNTYNYSRRVVDSITLVDKYVPTGSELISWDASEAKNKSVMGYLVQDSEGLIELILSGNGYGKIYANSDSSMVFSHTSYDDDYPSDLFWDVTSIANLNLLDTSNATTMKAMFSGIDGITTLDLSLSTLNTANVTDMTDMFKEMSFITSIDASGLDTSNVTTMHGMFEDCFYLTDLDLSSFNTTNVTDMSYMYSGCFDLTDPEIASFNTANVTNMSHMFSACYELADFNFPATFTTSTVIYMDYMFSGCVMAELDLTQFDTSNVENMNYMFSRCESLTDLDISSFDTSNVTTMRGMFNFCSVMTSLDLTHFVTNKVEDMSYMFNYCSALTTIYATHRFNTDAVTESTSMFRESPLIVGGAGTTWTKSKVDKTYALIDGGTDNPGYFTNNIFLSYNDVMVGGTSDAQLTIKSTVFDDYTSKSYSVVSGTAYASVDASSGKVTGIAEGTATIQVTLGASNGDTITAQATVNVIPPLPILAEKQTWYTQGGTGIAVTKITRIDIVDSYDTTGKTIVDDWDASADMVGTVTAYLEDDGSGSTYKLTLAGNGTGCVFANPNSSGAFGGFKILKAVNEASILDTSKTTTMRSMFNDCYKLSTLDTSNWVTNNVTDMAYMFDNCRVLTSVDTSNWVTSSVTDMSGMFGYCYKLNSLDVSGWDTSNVTLMKLLFTTCKELPAIEVSNWDVSNVTDAYGMFHNCIQLTDLDVSQWTISNKMVDTAFMFSLCKSLQNLDVSSWDMSNVTSTLSMFSGCSSLTTLPVDSWDVSSDTNMTDMFKDCSAMTSLNIADWDTSSATQMGMMFRGCSSLTTLAVDDWDVSNVTSMKAMFYGCSGLTSLNVSDWQTTSLKYVTDSYGELNEDDDTYYYWDLGMFEGCSSLTAIDISGWDMDQITNNAHMFSDCTSLKSLTIPANLAILSPEFAYNCTSLTEIIFNHGTSDSLSMPTAGQKTAKSYASADTNGVYSDGGAFYVPELLSTTITAEHGTATNYDWEMDNRTLASSTSTASMLSLRMILISAEEPITSDSLLTSIENEKEAVSDDSSYIIITDVEAETIVTVESKASETESSTESSNTAVAQDEVYTIVQDTDSTAIVTVLEPSEDVLLTDSSDASSAQEESNSTGEGSEPTESNPSEDDPLTDASDTNSAQEENNSLAPETEETSTSTPEANTDA